MKTLQLFLFTSLISISHLYAADPKQQLIDLLKRNVNGDFEDSIRERLNQNDVNTLFNGQGFLHFAAACGAVDVMEMLHSKSADINLCNRIGSTSLHYAAYNGHSKAVTFLLTHGADSNKRDCSKKTPADLARERGHQNIANLIDNWQDLPEIKEPDVE